MSDAAFRVDVRAPAWAALVGAGPGDAGLLTRRGADLLAAADVVLHDRLVSPDVLALVGPSAQLVDVGKAKGCGCPQAEIERLLVAFRREERRVVRLKGGDPFLFGRGIEEVRALQRAGYEVEVVPGVSSALAAPELAGISVTERGRSGHVTIVSGHRAAAATTDWPALAAVGGTLVVLMAASTGPAIAAQLVAAGLAPATPVAVVAAASRPDQLVVHTTAEALASWCGSLPGPCVVVIGPAAAAPDPLGSTPPPTAATARVAAGR